MTILTQMPVYLKDIREFPELESVKSVLIIPGMRTEGIMSIKPLFHIPCNMSLELNNVTPLVHQTKHSVAWITL